MSENKRLWWALKLHHGEPWNWWASFFFAVCFWKEKNSHCSQPTHSPPKPQSKNPTTKWISKWLPSHWDLWEAALAINLGSRAVSCFGWPLEIRWPCGIFSGQSWPSIRYASCSWPTSLPATIKISRAPLHNEVTIRTGLLQIWEGPKLYRISHVAGIRNIGHKHFPISSQTVMILDLVLCYSSTTLYFPRTTYIISSNIASLRQTVHSHPETTRPFALAPTWHLFLLSKAQLGITATAVFRLGDEL